MARLELKDVEIRLGERAILPNLNLTVEEGECLALLGPSGCGKTTTLRTVAGFLRPSQGSVMIGGKSVANVPTNKRNVGIVFQDYALFPHMSVSENVNFGLKARGIGGAEAKSRVAEALAQVRLSEFANRYPEQLSGGQRQRVALARAIVVRPDILLLDEPLGALDRRLRDSMQVELKQLQRDVGITTIIVTHDQEEALSLSDRIAVMFDGEITAIGSPSELYAKPSSLRVMDFLGDMNLIEGTVEGETLIFDGERFKVPQSVNSGEGRFGIRPEHLCLVDPGEAGVDCLIEEVVFKGPAVSVIAKTKGGMRLHVSILGANMQKRNLVRDYRVRISLPAEHLIALTG